MECRQMNQVHRLFDQQSNLSISSTDEIIADIKAGNMVILVDEEDRENEGDLVFAADFVTPEKINFMAKHGRGPVSYTHLRAHETRHDLVCRLLLEKKKNSGLRTPPTA